MKENKKTRIYLFVDGSNLYAGQYELFGPKKYLDFPKFIDLIETKLKLRFDKIHFYASYTPKREKIAKKHQKYIINEFQFYKKVKQLSKVTFFKGYRSKTSGKEKEVDVKLTADIVSLGFLNKYKIVYLLTGDADFLQALFTIKPLKKKVCLICLQNKLMYKGAFHFKTYAIVFDKIKLKFHPKQKLEVLEIKNPGELCHRVG